MLYLCATPIGNLGDISQRVLETLQQADLIAAEDTRRTRQLLSHFGIHTPLTSYHEHNEATKGKQLLERVLAGQAIAVVSDAGMPVISDPGSKLIDLAIELGVPFTVIPGPSAFLSALVLSGLDASRFTFQGFLPRTASARRSALADLSALQMTLVFYEAPHRLPALLEDLLVVLGDRHAATARELTKRYEEVKRGRISELASYWQGNQPRGEFVVVVAGAETVPEADVKVDWEGAIDQVNDQIAQGEEASRAIRTVSKSRGLSRRELYNRFHDRED